MFTNTFLQLGTLRLCDKKLTVCSKNVSTGKLKKMEYDLSIVTHTQGLNIHGITTEAKNRCYFLGHRAHNLSRHPVRKRKVFDALIYHGRLFQWKLYYYFQVLCTIGRKASTGITMG